MINIQLKLSNFGLKCPLKSIKFDLIIIFDQQLSDLIKDQYNQPIFDLYPTFLTKSGKSGLVLINSVMTIRIPMNNSDQIFKLKSDLIMIRFNVKAQNDLIA